MSLVNQNIINKFTGVFGQHFDIFSPFYSLVIFKEPIKTYSTDNARVYGYGPDSNETTITYTPVSGVYPAIIIFDKKQDKEIFFQTKSPLSKGGIIVKVKEDAKNFIEEGRNESFRLNRDVYNVISDPKEQNYLGLNYFYYKLEKTT